MTVIPEASEAALEWTDSDRRGVSEAQLASLAVKAQPPSRIVRSETALLSVQDTCPGSPEQLLLRHLKLRSGAPSPYEEGVSEAQLASLTDLIDWNLYGLFCWIWSDSSGS